MRSDVVKARRPLFLPMGRTSEEMQKPLVAIVNSQNELVPGHEHLDQVARAAREGVIAAGGTPFEFPAIGICDGWAEGHAGMCYPLPSRELIADSIEAMMMAHALDAMVLVTNCDKITPAMMMAMARLNLPSILISGGPMLPGRLLRPAHRREQDRGVRRRSCRRARSRRRTSWRSSTARRRPAVPAPASSRRTA